MAKIKINKTLRTIIIALAAIIIVFAITSLLPDKTFKEKYEGFDLSTNVGAASYNKTYEEYLQEHKNADIPDARVDIDVLDYDVAKSSGVSLKADYYGKDIALTDDNSSVSWNFNVEQEGFYNIEIDYICIPSRNVNMERILYINGEVPFSGAESLSFFRMWKDGGPIKEDNRGNSIRPTQIEYFDYQCVRFKNDMGYDVDPYKFYFEKGENSITLESTNEPMGIAGISLVPVKKYDTYEQYLARQKNKPEDDKGTGVCEIVQGENSKVRSDPSLFARYDRASATTVPHSVSKTVLNYSGGESWRSPGQWIEWDVEVPEDGWYTLSIKARQLYQRGYVAYRSVYIDGEIPIEELKSVGFSYSSDWNLRTLSDEKNVPYKFYLTKGTHSVRLEVTLGELGSIVNSLQDSIYRLNVIYRTILVLTGFNPDQYRDYGIDKVYPKEVEAMLQESRRLYSYVDEFVKITGEKSDKIAPAETLAIQLEQFNKHPDRITKGFINFKDNITGLGSAMLSISESKLDVDYIMIQSANDKIRKDKSNFFKNAGHEISSFATSFFVDSSSLGNVYDKNSDHLIEVWIVTGRDQSQILKNMVDDSFTPETGINVNVKLININSLLPAVTAGNGPDVVVSAYSRAPVDYALRNAVVDLKQFSDCDEVLKNFMPSAYESYRYDGGVFALPEQETFNLLFYRKDILDQLGLEVPKTWNELIEILPTLQGNNLSVGIPYPTLITAETDILNLYSMIYQRGGSVYNSSGTKSVIDSEEGIAAFKLYTSFYSSYGLPVIFDFVSRFRTGEMPLGIQNYTAYNTLSVSAPEIRGLWDFTYIPGTLREDGTIDRSNIASTVCTMMIKKDPGEDSSAAAKEKNASRMNDAWEFMKWWSSTDTQVRYGREQEALLGSSGRYATANVEALKQLSWKTKQIDILTTSLNETIGLPEIPGSYYTARFVVNGVRHVFNEKDDPRETLIDYTRKVNEEITRKRQEFNLPVEEN
ncbi:MAG: extracellular solute-binding protein [Spirochaetales bacterium]|nr:extracellular solute-binding protein [Spirochaetales bacterium]